MALGSKILLEPNPKGRFLEGVAQGALKPGTVVQLDVSEAADGTGRFTYEFFAAGDGVRAPSGVLVVLPHLDGQLATEAYADGDRIRLYAPANGEELNIVVQDASCTRGDVMILDSGTGELIATTGTPESEPFQMLETLAAAGLGRAIFTGS